MIVIDSNIFMYAAGAIDPHKQPSVDLLMKIGRGEVEAVVDAEVLQEILHRYRSIRRWQDGVKVYRLVRRVVPSVVAVTSEIADAALALLQAHADLTARDAIHAAVCMAIEASAICSYDRHFDSIPHLKRLEPPQLL